MAETYPLAKRTPIGEPYHDREKSLHGGRGATFQLFSGICRGRATLPDHAQTQALSAAWLSAPRFKILRWGVIWMLRRVWYTGSTLSF